MSWTLGSRRASPPSPEASAKDDRVTGLHSLSHGLGRAPQAGKPGLGVATQWRLFKGKKQSLVSALPSVVRPHLGDENVCVMVFPNEFDHYMFIHLKH